ncbi:hypothetical protein J3R08_001961 [Micromonospora sp. HB375]|uniref:golvesin C-terminal-like domain-containing protein n=1 Tax=Micromonospora TaxID=1873 RepID=UPI001AE47664|nr:MULTISPECIES: GDSL-type esterase/lipase family protein [unclassified Micromonospora]MBP1782111.1 hypothetical protein [Micromonospora sp. HB375]MBQ1062604.1 hypothetical protein [Micromonospora sp. C41]MDH6470814.1 hypothetical protein [Micromonospora sp. H404/HB375]
MKIGMLLTPGKAVVAAVAAVALLSGPALSAVARAEPATPPPSAPAATAAPAGPAGPADRVAPGDRDRILPKGWRGSADRVWTTSGDANGFHILTATAATGYTWETTASLAEPGFDVDLWIGNACVTGSGRRLVVVYAPRTFTNKAELFDRGGFTAVVDLKTRQVTKLPVQSSLAYFNPGCGAGEQAVLSQLGGENREDPTSAAPRSRLFTVDAAARTLSKPILLNTELSSPVPVKDGIVAAAAGGLVSVARTGKVTRSVAATGVPFRLAPDAAGGVIFMDSDGQQTRVKRAVGRSVRELARGHSADVGLARGDGGRTFITGRPAHMSALPAAVRRIAVPRDSELSTRGELALTQVKAAGTGDPRTQGGDPSVARNVAVTATVTRTGRSLTFEVSPEVVGPEAIAGRATHPKLGAAAAATMPRSRIAADASEEPVEADRYCSVPRNDPANQAVQPKPRNVEWAVDQAVFGRLNDAASRPANWKGYGMPAYEPQTLFPAPPLAGGGRVPAQIMLGIITQESNMWQASKFALPGVPANPLMGNYYGRDIYNATSLDDWDIDWTKADCGYGLTQATDGMRLAGHEKTDANGNKVEVSLPFQTQRAVALDFTANIAYGLKILQEKWNQTYAAGLRVHNADPSALENWFYAVWAYNSGFYPKRNDADPWGVGWLNNPINPRYDPLRHPFMTSYDDARTPQNWPYPEKVLGWAGNPISATESPGVERPGFNYAWWNLSEDKPKVKPPLKTFCDSTNQCDPYASVQPNDPDVSSEKPGPCLHKNTTGLYDLRCWAHSAVGWKAPPGVVCDTCGHEQIRFDPGYPWCTTAGQTACESDGISYPPHCQDSGGDLAAGAKVVDNVPLGSPSPRSCPRQLQNQGTFRLSFTGVANGTYPSKIDFHQVGGGYGGHYWRASTRTPAAQGGNLKVTGTWRLNDTGTGWRRVQVFVPEFGAWTQQAKYTIDLGNGETRYRVINQTWQQNKWVDLGTFNFRGQPSVSLTTVAKDGTGDDSIIFDAVAFSWPSPSPPGVPEEVGGMPRYVALGDSYSSGEGVAPYDRNSDLRRTNGTKGSNVDACHRSTAGAYPRLVHDPGRDFVRDFPNDHYTIEQMSTKYSWGSFGFIACSGATTAAVTRDAVNVPPAASDTAGHTDWGQVVDRWGELTQVEQGWLDPETTHVSISIGGNDARFSDVLTGCIATLNDCSGPNYRLTRSNGVVDPEPLRDYQTKIIRDWLPAKLKATYRAIHTAAPNAQIFVVGYPQMFPNEEGNNACYNISSQARLFLNAMAGRISIAIARVVDDLRAEGVDIRYIHTTAAISVGNSGQKKWACGGDDGYRWLNAVTSTSTDGSGEKTPGTGTFHPTARGQQGFADLLTAAFADARRPRADDVAAIKKRILDYSAKRAPTDDKGRWIVTDQQAKLAAERCLDLTRRGGIVGNPCLSKPILFPTAFDARGAARNDDAAIDANPPWVQLRYVNGSTEKPKVLKSRSWFMNAPYGQTSCPTTRPEDQCDEYPFYTSEEGGAWDFFTGGENSPLSTRLLMIPAAENRAEGSMVGAMYSHQDCRMQTGTYEHIVGSPGYQNQLLTSGTEYLTVPLTDEAAFVGQKTMYVC